MLPSTYNTTSPGFFGYFAGGGLPEAAVADLIGGVVNRFVGRWAAAPGASQIEVNVLRWFADMVGYPASARGVLTSGGSLANLTAVFTARQHHLGYELADARIYVSEHIHFSIPKPTAIGGFFALTERGQRLLAGIGLADSITLDPHKSLFLPYGTGALLVRKGDVLKRVHEVEADFDGPLHDDGDAIDFCSYSIEQTRPFRGLRIWLPLALHGIAPFRDNLDEKLDLAATARRELRAIAGLELLAGGELTVLSFRLVPIGDAEAARNRALVEAVNARGRVFLMTTELGGHLVVRMCILSFRAHLDHVIMALVDIRKATAEILAQHT